MLGIGPLDLQPGALFEFRRMLGLPPWSQAVLIAGLFTATVLLTHAEYAAKGTVFGFPGPGFNVLIAPIWEELVFRGWILGMLARRLSGPWAIVWSSLLFGLFHLRNIYWLDGEALARMMIYTGLVIGPVLGYVALRCRSLWPAVVLHYANNLAFYL